MGEVVNLNKARKARDKAAATKRAAVRPGLRKRSPDLTGL